MGEVVICGVRFRIDFSFLVFAALIFIIEEGALVSAFFTVCLIHEIGHAAAICMSGGKISSVTFYGTGIIMTHSRREIIPLKTELFILLSGPAINIFLYFILRKLHGMEQFALLNLCAAVFNLLPYSSLDGGSVLRLLADNLQCGRAIRTFMRTIQAGLSALLLIASLKEPAAMPFFCVSVFYFLSEIKLFRC